MRIDRWKRAADLAFAAMGTVLLSACTGVGTGEDCILGDSGSTWQLSPSGQAVALVDPVAYGRVLQLRSSNGFPGDCVVQEFLGRFGSDAEAIVLIHDIEGRLYTVNRMLIEHGLFPIGADDLSNIREAVPSDILAAADALPLPTLGGFNYSLRALESGVGPVQGGDLSWVPDDLRGYLFLPKRQELVEGKFLHELGHFWAAHLVGPPALAGQIEKFGFHWGYTSVGGVLGGWLPDTLESLGDNVYQGKIAPAGWAVNIIPYAPLELYLMGLAGTEEVPPIEIAIGAEMVEPTDLSTFLATSFETVTIDDIVKANGPRIPTSSESEKHFRLALIILTDHELSDAEWDFYRRSIDFASAAQSGDVLNFFPEETYPEYYYSLSALGNVWSDSQGRDPEQVLLNFYMATGGRGTIEFVQIAAK